MDILQGLAAELVQSRVDIIVTWLTRRRARPSKRQTKSRLVMAGAGDPVGRVLLPASLNRV